MSGLVEGGRDVSGLSGLGRRWVGRWVCGGATRGHSQSTSVWDRDLFSLCNGLSLCMCVSSI